jgi:WD40 repeat protein
VPSLFVSYHRPDNPAAVDRVVEALLASGYADLFAFDRPGQGGALGERWEQELRTRVLTCDALVVLTGPGARASARCAQELVLAGEAEPRPYIAEIVVAGDRGNDLLADRHRVVWAADPEVAVRALLDGLAEAGVDPAAPARASSPYPGLAPFDESRARFFLGRDADIRALRNRLDLSGRSAGALCVVGPSGVGKSSLVRAGLVPALKSAAQHRWLVAGPVTPRSRPIESLAAALCAVARQAGSAGATEPAALAQVLRQGGATLGPALADLLPATGNTRYAVLLDQAEELVAPDAGPDAQALVGVLTGLLSADLAWVVSTLRSDFVTEMLVAPGLAPLLGETQMVAPLDHEAVWDVIARPVRAYGWRYEPEVLAELVADMADVRSLPLLAYLLNEIFRTVTAEPRADRVITRADYEATGRLEAVLALRAEVAFQDAVAVATGTTTDPAAAVLAQLLRLVTVRADGTVTRRVLSRADLTPGQVALLQPFVSARVLAATDEAFDVIHEALFAGWARLRDAIDAVADALRARSDLERRCTEWRRLGRPADGLLPQSALLDTVTVLRQGSAPDAAGRDLGWAALGRRLEAAGVTADQLEYVGAALQRSLTAEVERAERVLVTDPGSAGRLLTGSGSELQRALVRLNLAAPDLRPLVTVLHRAMAADPAQLVLHCHPGGAWGAAWAPGDDRFATGGRDQAARTWSVRRPGPGAGRLLCELTHGEETRGNPPGRGWVRDVAWSGDGAYVLSVATDETLRIWDGATGAELRPLVHPDRLWSVHTPKAGGAAITSCADGTARVYPVGRRTREPAAALHTPQRQWDAALSPDGDRAVVGCDDRNAYVFDLGRPDGPRLVLAHPAPVRAVAWSPDGAELGTGGQDDRTRIFDAATGGLVRELAGHTDQVRSLAWSGRGHRVATGSADRTIRVWDAHTGRELAVLAQHSQGVCAVDWSARGDRLLSAADDGTARIWKIGPEPARVIPVSGPATTLAWSTSGRQLAVGCGDHAELVDLESGDVLPLAAAHSAAVRSLDWSPEGSALLSGSADRTATRRGLGPAAGADTSYVGARDGVVRAAWSPDGRTVLVAARDRVVRLYDAGGARRTGPEVEAHDSFLTDAAWDPSGTRYAVVSTDHRLSVHDLATGHHQRVDAGGGLESVAWDRTGRRIAVGRTDGTILLYDCPGLGADLTDRLAAHSRAVAALAWSPDRDLLCAASADGHASVWDASTGALRTRLVGHGQAVTGCAWISATEVVTCGADGTVRTWDVTDGEDAPLSGLPGSDPRTPADGAAYAAALIDVLADRLDPGGAAGPAQLTPTT